MMPEPICANCVWWKQHQPNPDGTEAVVGECRVDGPRIGEADRGKWPYTHKEDWCGRWHVNYEDESK